MQQLRLIALACSIVVVGILGLSIATEVRQLSDDVEMLAMEVFDLYETVGIFSRELVDLSSPVTWSDADMVWEAKNNLGCGSAFPVSCEPIAGGQYRVLFLTAAHVSHYEDMIDVPPGMMDEFNALEKSFTLSHHSGLVITGALPYARHDTRDAGLIEAFTSFPISPRRLRPVTPLFGSRLIMSGYPACYGLWVSQGVASEPGIASFTSYGGCSGGPVSNEEGQVVGILVAGLRNGFETIQFASFYVTIESIQDWLDETI